jgi:glycosyltransferase involved in cell wall biosynthesis
MTIIVVANSVSYDNTFDHGMSGGDRILIELLKYWKDKSQVKLITCNSGERMIKRYITDHLSNIKTILVETPRLIYRNLFVLYLYKTIMALYAAATVKLENNIIVFSSSDFFTDVLPALFIKLRNRKKIKWIAAFYLFAPHPISKDFPYKGVTSIIRGVIYYYTQKLCYQVIRRLSDYVIACNEVDKKVFIDDGYPKKKICAIYGGVDLKIPESVPEPSNKIYDCVFMARFHPQKAPLLALKVWADVIKVLPQAKLAMIGNGSEEFAVREYIVKNHLDKSVTLFGFKDGAEKYAILKSSRVFIHPAIYETGGMAAAEGMAAGLPVIAFDHEGFKYAYPQGLIRVSPIGDVQNFANAIVSLLQDKAQFEKIRLQAIELIHEWDWKIRIPFILGEVSKGIVIGRG